MTKYLLPTALALAFLAPVARADIIYNVTLDTTVLANNNPGQGPFLVDFQLNDGSGVGGDGNNTATISNFMLTGGSLTAGTESSSGPPFVNGDLNPGDTLSISDGTFFNDFNQQFTPGSQLSFTLDLTTNFSAAEKANSPDEFSFTVYGNLNASNPPGPSTVSLLTIDITGPNPQISTSGGALNNGAVTPGPSAATAPEPSTLVLSLIGLAGLAGSRLRRRTQLA